MAGMGLLQNPLDTDQHVHFSTQAPSQLRCEAGLIWITCRGQLHDWVLREGETMELAAGDWLIGALRPSLIRFVSHTGPALRQHPRWQALMAQFARRLLRVPPALASRC